MGDAVFEYCSNLEDLKLFNNLITELHAKAFAGLVKLQKLDLKQNLLESIDKAVFEPIHETLTELRLNSNKITSIAAHTFGCQSNTCSGKWTFTKLDLLDLSGNELQYVLCARPPPVLRFAFCVCCIANESTYMPLVSQPLNQGDSFLR